MADRKYSIKKLFLIIFLATLVILLIYPVYGYFRYVKYISSLQKSAYVLYSDFAEFEGNYWDAQPRNNQDIEKIQKWAESMSKEEEYRYFFVENGFNVKYDSEKGNSIIYSYGPDGKDGNLKNTPYNLSQYVLGYEYYQILTPSFSEYMRDMLNHDGDVDILLLNIPHLDKTNSCEGILEERVGKEPFFQLFNGSQNLKVKEEESGKFKEFIKDFSREYWMSFDIPAETLNSTGVKRILFMFSRGDITNLCDNSLSKKQIKDLEQQLTEYFRKGNTDYFDFAVFSFRVPNSAELNNNQ